MSKRVEAIIAANPENTIFHALGITIEKLDADETICALTIDKRHYQHLGLVHGGLYVLLAESAASIAGACVLERDDQSIVCIEINANHVHMTREGTLRAISKSLHRGKKTLVYEVRVLNEENRLISVARATLMIISS